MWRARRRKFLIANPRTLTPVTGGLPGKSSINQRILHLRVVHIRQRLESSGSVLRVDEIADVANCADQPIMVARSHLIRSLRRTVCSCFELPSIAGALRTESPGGLVIGVVR